MGEVVVGGIPCFVRRRDVDRSKTVRMKKKKRGLVNSGIERLNGRQKKALTDLMESKDLSNAGKREAGIVGGYSETYALQGVNRLLARKPVSDELEKAGVTDARIAQVIAEGLEAKHPMAPLQKDYHAIVKFVREANTIRDNYPPKQIEQRKQEQIVIMQFTGQDLLALEKVNRMRGQT